MKGLLYGCGIFLLTDIFNLIKREIHNLIKMGFLSEKPDIYSDCKGVGVELFKIKY